MSYDIEVNTGYGAGGSFTVLEWTTEPPTQEGWYWAHESIVNAIVIVRVTEDLRVRDVFVRSRALGEYTHWLGPLPLPEMPKG